MIRHIHTLTDADVGKSIIHKVCDCCGQRRAIFLGGALGRVFDQDVGKRVYDVDGVIQVENNEQRSKRLAKAHR